MKRYVIAVSGGVDSVVLLHMMAAKKDSEIVVAHFDHGIREDSRKDADFVKGLADRYGLLFISERAELGVDTSEDKARQARYRFLRRVAREHDAVLMTAHHSDDVIETIIINSIRGTGWRGLCSLRNGAIVRPLLNMSKQEIIAYARQYTLTWREDSTNEDMKYLRNYIRHAIVPRFSDEAKAQFLDLYTSQLQLLSEIEAEGARLLPDDSPYDRYIFIMSDKGSARELLSQAIARQTSKSMTRPQLDRAVMAIKTHRIGTYFEIGQGVQLVFSRAQFIVEEKRS